MITNTISVVIGSWGSYNECNERAYGSKWLDLSDYADWEEIEEELIKEGFILDGIDEELFIQDIEGIDSRAANWDYTNPQTLFEMITESEILLYDYKYETFEAFVETHSFKEFEDLVNRYGSRWDDDIRLWKGYDWEDYGREIFLEMGYKIPECLEDFIDFEAYGKYCGECVTEYSDGLIEIFY